MQRTFVAIALALTLTCAFAAYTPQNFVKAPQQVVDNSDTNFTNMTGGIGLASVTIGDIYIIGQNYTVNKDNSSNGNWAIWLRKLDAKSLTSGANTSYTFTQPQSTFYYNNYAVAITGDNDTGIPQLRVYQQPLTGGAALGRLTPTTNTNASWFPLPAGAAMIGKNVYMFYVAANQKINVTSFTIGGTVGTNEFTLTTAYTAGLTVAWGEALSTSQVFAAWIETETLKDAVIDLSKGTFTPSTVGAYDKAYACSAYATDKKYYGELCSKTNFTEGTVNYYIRTNTTSLVSFFNGFTNTSTLAGAYAYGPYLATFWLDTVTTEKSKVYTYEIWNLETLTTFKAKTTWLTIDVNSTWTNFRVPAGGIYTLLWNNRLESNGTLSNIQVGLLLGSSYLTSVLGFILTIIAGLLLF